MGGRTKRRRPRIPDTVQAKSCHGAALAPDDGRCRLDPGRCRSSGTCLTSAEHGAPVMRLRLCLTTAVVVSSAGAAREAITRHDAALSARAVPDMARAAWFADRSVIWLPGSDPRWKALRGVLAARAFSQRGLAAARGARERGARELVGHLRARAGEEVDVGRAVYGGVLNLVSGALFSVDVVDVGAESAQGLRGLVEGIVEAVVKPNVSDLFPFLRPLDLQGWRRWTAGRFAKVFRVLDDIVDRRLADASSSGKHVRGDFLGALLELMSAGKITHDTVTTIMFDVFAAGSDTIAVTVEWAMTELLRHPSVMSKVREEIEGALGGKEAVEEPDAVGLPYLRAVVKEAMRLHPVAPLLLPHQAAEDGVEIGGYAVPRGSTVIFNAWAIMRDPAAWERPDDFVPERFLGGGDDEAGFRGKDSRLIPFGSGRRLCPGVPMAERVVPLMLASLLHAFEWRLPDGVSAEQLDVSEKFTTANVLAVPLRAVPVVVT
ncbi:hypothetical protein C2845_PM13G19650 [Panicum miliaceum]|uniref:Cytochrome P450 76M5-like n=1 Tax=Panicum miliaceum TaxID=4540 RepID=A0A3L6RJX6_PANMI|nr:hypothetical protein C2845_PM13G19650 [Panicum miliaceum]